MKTFLILSDTHGNISAMEKLRPIMSESDYIIHLGDYSRDIAVFYSDFKDKIRSVKGNCDGGGEDAIIEEEGIKILLTHGDKHKVKGGTENLFSYAKERGASLVLFGHTHKAVIEEKDGITLINPGTLSKYSQNSYCYAVLNKGKTVAKTVYLY